MVTILTGSLILSLLHAIIPNHWLPVIAIGRKNGWSLAYTTRITLLAGFSHALSTVFLGMVLGVIGLKLSGTIAHFTHMVAPILVIMLGIFFIYQHYHHQHFHLNESRPITESRIILSLLIAMFFSPCIEVEGYFLLAGSYGIGFVLLIALLYTLVSVSGMVIWVRFAYAGLEKINWHKIEHNAGIITGLTLIVTGIISFYIH